MKKKVNIKHILGTKYIIDRYWFKPEIVEIEFIRETDAFYWTVDGNRHKKHTTFDCAYDSRERALSVLLQMANDQVIDARNRLLAKEEKLKKIQAIK